MFARITITFTVYVCESFQATRRCHLIFTLYKLTLVYVTFCIPFFFVPTKKKLILVIIDFYTTLVYIHV